MNIMTGYRRSNLNLVDELIDVNRKDVARTMKVIMDHGKKRDLVTNLAKIVMGEIQDDWWGSSRRGDVLVNGVYTPLQLLFYYSATKSIEELNHDYPFAFGTIGALLSTLLTDNHVYNKKTAETYRKMIQTLFKIREMREESEGLSMETYLSKRGGQNTITPKNKLRLKKLAQLYGRGVGVISAESFDNRTNVEETVTDVFTDHKTAPSSLLYNLGRVYSNLLPLTISLSLKNDRNVIFAIKDNPLLEFYDGGWHITDLKSGEALLDYCLSRFRKFQKIGTEPKISENILSLAYYMASHWQSGILAIVDHEKAEKVLEPQKEWSKISTEIISNLLNAKGKQGGARIEDLKTAGFGRVLLTNAIQDGATIFSADGVFRSAGRIVNKFSKEELNDTSWGTGNRAAHRLSSFGIALKVSEDGAIRLFSSLPKGNKYLNKGLRIR